MDLFGISCAPDPPCAGSLSFALLLTIVVGGWTLYFAMDFWNRFRPNQDRFLLMNLPPEVRLIIFDHLIGQEQASNPIELSIRRRCIPPRLEARNHTSAINPIFGALFKKPQTHLINILPLVSRQIRNEFMQLFYQRETFTFTLDASHTQKDPLWVLSPENLASIRRCHLVILASPGIVGAFDPRSVSGRWRLRDEVFDRMNKMGQLKDLRLSIQAIGNQLWNPIWLWHYTSQAFKESKVQAFRRISFELEGWSMREPNHLARRADSQWEWRCSEDHFVLPDTAGPQPVRQFCGALYADCNTCEGTAS